MCSCAVFLCDAVRHQTLAWDLALVKELEEALLHLEDSLRGLVSSSKQHVVK